ncbi:MAG: hypothetical protein WDN24_05025 [Sphingomonas sp.]
MKNDPPVGEGPSQDIEPEPDTDQIHPEFKRLRAAYINLRHSNREIAHEVISSFRGILIAARRIHRFVGRPAFDTEHRAFITRSLEDIREGVVRAEALLALLGSRGAEIEGNDTPGVLRARQYAKTGRRRAHQPPGCAFAMHPYRQSRRETALVDP